MGLSAVGSACGGDEEGVCAEGEIATGNPEFPCVAPGSDFGDGDGSNDCSDDSIVGTWSTDKEEDDGINWLVFQSNCDVQVGFAGYSQSTTPFVPFEQVDSAVTIRLDEEVLQGSLDATTDRFTLAYAGETRAYKRYVPEVNNCPAGSDALVIDRFDAPEVVPPAGLRFTFRVLDCLGNPIRPLTPEDVTVINDEKGEPFGSGGEGDSVSDVAPPSNFGLFSVLALDMSQSIVGAGAQDAVIDGALAFVDALVTKPEAAFKHSVAVVAFGARSSFKVVQDFTKQDVTLVKALEGLRGSPSLGTTDVYGTYRSALDMVSEQGEGFEIVERFVVLLTDGTHEAGDEENERNLALQAKSNTDATTYSIGIQGNYDESKLRELASTPDNFVRAEDASKLATAFEGVAIKVAGVARSNYVIGVCTPITLGNPSLTLRIEVDGKIASKSVYYSVSELTGDTAMCKAEDVAKGTSTQPDPGDPVDPEPDPTCEGPGILCM